MTNCNEFHFFCLYWLFIYVYVFFTLTQFYVSEPYRWLFYLCNASECFICCYIFFTILLTFCIFVSFWCCQRKRSSCKSKVLRCTYSGELWPRRQIIYKFFHHKKGGVCECIILLRTILIDVKTRILSICVYWILLSMCRCVFSYYDTSNKFRQTITSKKYDFSLNLVLFC